MDTLVFLAQGFIGMFNKGGETFIGLVSGIVPTLICLLVAMNAIIRFVGTDKVENSLMYAPVTSSPAIWFCRLSERSSSATR